MKISGVVIKGDGRGKQLGFPTANIELSKILNLKHGIYAALVRVNNEVYKGALFYGIRTMFGHANPSLEVYIFDFNKDIYNQSVLVDIKDFIRANQTFDSIDSLIDQINIDCEVIKEKLKQ